MRPGPEPSYWCYRSTDRSVGSIFNGRAASQASGVNHQASSVQAGLQVGKGHIHVLQPIRSGQQLVELQLSLAIPRKQAQGVAMDVRASVPAAEQTFLHDRNEEDVQADRLFARADADHHARASFAHGGVSLLDRFLA